MNQFNILIMGPIGVGKTTVSEEISRRTGKKLIEMDDERERLYSETDFSPEEGEEQYLQHGIMGWYQYQKKYELYSVKRLLEENDNAVISFGGGQSVYDKPEQVREFLALVEPEPFVFLLMPYPDEEKSLAHLAKRISEDDTEMNKIFVASKSSRQAAKFVIYTEEKTVSEICNEIIQLIEN